MSLVAATFAMPVGLFASAVRQDVGSVQGKALDAAKQPQPNATVRLVQGRSLAATATTDSAGNFVFSGIKPGSYTLEIVVNGKMVGTLPVTVAAGQIATVTISASAIGALAGTGGFSIFGLGTAASIGTIVGGAAIIGTVAYQAQKEDASPSR